MSLGAPLGIDVTANTAPAEQGLDRIDKKLKQVEQSSRKATVAARDLNAELSKDLKRGALAARSTGAGGAFGAAAQGVNQGGAMGVLGAVAAAGAVLMQVVTRFTDLAESNAKLYLAASASLSSAAEKAKEMRETSAQRGFTQEEQYRQAFAAGGPKAIANADAMIKKGYKTEDAYRVASMGEMDWKQQFTLDTVAARGGDVTKAAENLKKKPWLTNFPDDIAFQWDGLRLDEFISPAADEAMGIKTPTDPNNDKQLRSDMFARAAEEHRKTLGKRDLADRDNARNGFGKDSDSRALMGATNPEILTKNDAVAAMQKSVDALADAAKEQSAAAKLIADMFSPSGSFETQMIRLMNANSRAQLRDP